MAILAVDQFALIMREVKERRVVPLHIIQRQDIDVDVGDFPVSERHLVTQIAFGLNPIVRGRFAHDHQQVIGHGVAMACTADQFSEQQDIFGGKIAVRQAIHNLGGFSWIVEFFRWLFGLWFWLWSKLPRRLFRRGYGLLFGLGTFGGYALCRLFLHRVLIRFHLVDC